MLNNPLNSIKEIHIGNFIDRILKREQEILQNEVTRVQTHQAFIQHCASKKRKKRRHK